MFGSKTGDSSETISRVGTVDSPRPPPVEGSPPPADFLNTGNSIIGSDLVIHAQDLIIISQTSLQLHGKTTGEVRATEIVIGESAEITGTVAAETIVVHGEVVGTLRAPSVSLSATARVEGEIQHHSFEIIRGAIFHGQAHYDAESSNLMPNLDSA